MESNMKLISLVMLLISYQVLASERARELPFVYDTKVISDRGGYSVSEYLPTMDRDNTKRQREVYEDRRSKKLVQAHFPVISKTLKVGRLTSDQAKDLKFQMVSQPIFMIGYDKVSIDWLKANRQHLSRNKAIGMVVNVMNPAQMEELQRLAGQDIILQPTPGDSLAEHLKIRNYPFYMDSKGVMR